MRPKGNTHSPVRELITSVSIHDCEVQTFRCGGHGGQNVNKRDTGVRVIHHPSGARGESREERSQLANKRAAFKRMAESWPFRQWAMAETIDTPPARDLKVEYWIKGQWQEQ